MLAQLRQHLLTLQRPAGLDGGPGSLPLGIETIDTTLGGGLLRGALHEIAAAGEAHLAAAAGFAAALGSAAWTLSPRTRGERHLVWLAEDMALAESGALYGPGLMDLSLAPERLLTVAVAQRRDLLWAMEEALRCRVVGAVIGELRHGALDAVAVRRLSLAAADSGALALLLRAKPGSDASTAATRWIAGAAPSAPVRAEFGFGAPRFAVHLVRNRRGPTGSWILEWSDTDERFVLATHSVPVAAPAFHRSRRQVA